jgi:hypothetical protein
MAINASVLIWHEAAAEEARRARYVIAVQQLMKCYANIRRAPDNNETVFTSTSIGVCERKGVQLPSLMCINAGFLKGRRLPEKGSKPSEPMMWMPTWSSCGQPRARGSMSCSGRQTRACSNWHSGFQPMPCLLAVSDV